MNPTLVETQQQIQQKNKTEVEMSARSACSLNPRDIHRKVFYPTFIICIPACVIS